MAETHVLTGARNVVLPNSTVNAAGTMVNNIHHNYGNRTTSGDAIIPLTPNPSSRFTGRTEIIAKLKEHFMTDTNDSVRRRKFFLLYGMGGIGKTQICLKLIEEMSD
ncbi:hypothetical protein K443DRAFT_114277 [Laccaria amethystina LaAM-08-1]|uniref:NB-ARC domain-containing protein n=1 Tax=Laccaria amethystina LaAM-08-1 TaxID=1095629 RepID=A0A0C9X2Z6_9AGAR|nr:hypothetical protein K443DRAFT_114277 [Laccaria amethystina LaAM-08-1]